MAGMFLSREWMIVPPPQSPIVYAGATDFKTHSIFNGNAPLYDSAAFRQRL